MDKGGRLPAVRPVAVRASLAGVRRVALAAVLALPAAPGGAEFFWEGLMPYVKPGVAIVIQEPECADECRFVDRPRAAPLPGAGQTGGLERTPWAPPASGRGE